MRSPVRLVRNSDAARLFDTFLVVSIATVLLTRLYLSITGFPSISGAGLHIAHLLPGGILMLVAILITLGSINRSSRDAAAVLGGVGFGLFWDEIGKFITQDNNYFFQPAVGIIYLTFVSLYLLTRYVIHRSYHPQDYLANAIDLIMEGAIGELDPREYARAKELLQKADKQHPMYKPTVALLEQAKPSKNYQPFIIDRLVAMVHRPFHTFVRKPWFTRALLGVFYVYGLLLAITFIPLTVSFQHEPLFVLFTPGASSNVIAALSSGISAAYIMQGAWYVQKRQTHTALRRFETAIIINIFITQAFLFFRYQLTALTALVGALGLLFAIRILLSETADTKR